MKDNGSLRALVRRSSAKKGIHGTLHAKDVVEVLRNLIKLSGKRILYSVRSRKILYQEPFQDMNTDSIFMLQSSAGGGDGIS